jgi:hypothetical protein
MKFKKGDILIQDKPFEKDYCKLGTVVKVKEIIYGNYECLTIVDVYSQRKNHKETYWNVYIDTAFIKLDNKKHKLVKLFYL